MANCEGPIVPTQIANGQPANRFKVLPSVGIVPEDAKEIINPKGEVIGISTNHGSWDTVTWDEVQQEINKGGG